MSTITIQSEGRRHYLIGDTYPIKNAIRGAGCNWDRDRGAWWTGKREVAEQLVAGVQSGAVAPAARWVKLATGFGVRVPAGVEAAPGSKLEVQSRDGGTREVEIAALVETCPDGSRVFAVPPRKSSGGGRSFRRAGKWTGCSCGSREDSSGQLIDSPRNCKQCRFDEYDC